MKFDILVETMVNSQPTHTFVQHHGVSEGKVDRLFREVVQEQYDRLERGRPIFRLDSERDRVAIMSRSFPDDAHTTVVVFVMNTNEARPYWEAQNEIKASNVQPEA